FLTGADQDRLNRRPSAYIEGADTLRCVQLMPGDAEQIHVELIHRDRYFANGLSTIGVYHTAGGMNACGEFCDRLNSPDLVLGQDQRAQPNRAIGHRRGPDTSLRVDAKAMYRPATCFETRKLSDCGGMFNARGDGDTFTSTRYAPADRQIIGFGASRRKNNFVGIRADQARHLFTRMFDGLPRG